MNNCKFCKHRLNETRTQLVTYMHFSAYCLHFFSDLGKFGKEIRQRVLLSFGRFRENRHKLGRNFRRV